MERRFRPLLFGVAALLTVATLVMAVRWLGNQADQQIVERPDIAIEPESESTVVKAQHPPLGEALGVNDEDFVEVGGIKRPKRDVAFDETSPKPVVSEKSPLPHPGNAPAVPTDAHPDVKSLHAELAKEKPNPAAVSSLFAPEPFDAEVYESDKEAWLTQVRPGRAFQPAQPGPDVKPISSDSDAFQRIVQGEKVLLTAKVEPGVPVTFYTPQVGEFSNRLTTQSVEAGADGIARATYTATKGTSGLIDIVAASPLHSGQLKYKVQVSLPQNN